MEPKILHGDLPADLPYEVVDLFPDALKYRQYDDLREYISDTLVELAENGKLSVTQIHQQKTQYCDMAGDIILGHRINTSDQTMELGVYVPEILQAYKVRLKSLADGNGNPRTIKHVRGMVEGKKTMGTRRTGKVRRVVREVADYGVEEGEFPLPTAWRILHQSGKYCVKISGGIRQARNRGGWTTEEVNGVQPKEPKVSKRGRPKTEDAN
jgi:hypothetical protein